MAKEIKMFHFTIGYVKWKWQIKEIVNI
jgi:hypothetical protein